MEDLDVAEQSEAFARELFGRHREFRSMVGDEVDDPTLYGLAIDLGNTLLEIARDPRLAAAFSSAAQPGDLKGHLAEVLVIDWAHLLNRFGYEPPPSAEDRADDVRVSILRFSQRPSPDTYQRLVLYLTDLGNRLVESDRPDTRSRAQRLRRRVGRGLWILGRVSLAAAAGAAVASVLASGIGAVTLAGVAAAAGGEVAKAVVERALPERLLSSDAQEDIDLQVRAERLNDLLNFGRLGQLRANLELEHKAINSGEELSRPFSTDVLLWISLVQGSLLVIRQLASVSGVGLAWSCDKLSSTLIDLRTAVRDNASTEQISDLLSVIQHVGQDVSQSLVASGYRSHRPAPTQRT